MASLCSPGAGTGPIAASRPGTVTGGSRERTGPFGDYADTPFTRFFTSVVSKRRTGGSSR